MSLVSDTRGHPGKSTNMSTRHCQANHHKYRAFAVENSTGSAHLPDLTVHQSSLPSALKNINNHVKEESQETYCTGDMISSGGCDGHEDRCKYSASNRRLVTVWIQSDIHLVTIYIPLRFNPKDCSLSRRKRILDSMHSKFKSKD